MAELHTTVARFLRREPRFVGAGLRPARPFDRGMAPLWGMAAVTTLLVILPVAYLILRFLGAGPAAFEVIWRIQTLQILARTLGLALSVTLLSAVIAIPLAWLTVRTDLPLRRAWTVLTVLPVVIPSYVGAFLIIAALGPGGLLAKGLENAFGIVRLPSIYGYPGALLALTLLSYPYLLLNAQASLRGQDPAFEEAARSLGLGPWKTFWRVTLPQLRPGLTAGGLLVLLYVLRDFGAVSMMRYSTFTRVLYIQYKSSFDRSTASGLALVLVLLTVGILALEIRLRGRSRYDRNLSTGMRPQAVIRLGRWRWPAFFFCLILASLALFMPMGVLAYWLVRGLRAGQQWAPLWAATFNSLQAAALAAATALLAAIPIAVLSVRRPGKWSKLFEQLTYSGFALPGIVIALALVFIGANFLQPLYGSLPILILAYLILFLPQAVGAVRSALMQLNPGVEEAARILGRQPLQVLTQVTLPLVRPGILSGGALVFLTTMKELPATLILSPFGFKTLATSVWSAVSEAFFAQAAAPALLLILMSSLPLLFLAYREKT